MQNQSSCLHPTGPLDIEAQADGYMRVVCPKCGLEGPWRRGLTITAIRAFQQAAKKQRKVMGVDPQPHLFA